MDVKISPSILSADFSRLGDQVREAEAAGADEIHFDVMDGQFVPAITFGYPILEAVRRVTDLPIDVHMMVKDPARCAAEYAQLPNLTMTIHVEATPYLPAAIETIRAAGIRPAVTLNPATPLRDIEHILPMIDRVLVMTVQPGAGGQPFQPEVLPKLESLRTRATVLQNPIEIAADGGIKAETARAACNAGARVLISGSAIFNHPAGIAAAITELRKAATTAP